MSEIISWLLHKQHKHDYPEARFKYEDHLTLCDIILQTDTFIDLMRQQVFAALHQTASGSCPAH